MTTSANNLKNPNAAFQVLRYMTYSTEGNLARLSMYDAKNKGKYALNSRIFYPTVNNKEVAEKFKSLPGVTDVDIYFFENTGNGYRSDLLKIGSRLGRYNKDYQCCYGGQGQCRCGFDNSVSSG